MNRPASPAWDSPWGSSSEPLGPGRPGGLRDYLLDPVRIGPLTPGFDGITVVLPSYSRPDGSTPDHLSGCLASLVRAAGDIRIAVVVIDNGLTAADRRLLTDQLNATGWAWARVPHPPEPGRRYQAAAARNAGLARLSTEPELTGDHVLFLDDDTLVRPSALVRLRAELASRPEAAAVFASLARSEAEAVRAEAGPSGPRRLPGPWLPDGQFAFLTATAYGSSITARALGLLVRAEAVAGFFEGTPFGSGEDILFTSKLLRTGPIWSVPSAVIIDQPRSTVGATRRQRLLWGYDHAWLYAALRADRLVPPGLQRLSWRDGEWLYTAQPDELTDGALIHPDEVALALELIAAVTAEPDRAVALFGELAEPVIAGLEPLAKAVGSAPVLTGPAGASALEIRLDLPELRARDFDAMSTGLDALVGQIAGNVAGSHHFGIHMAGVRQSGVPASRKGPTR